jgi:nitroreductase
MARHPDFEIESLFVERWSPRAMDGRPVTADVLMRLFEAARWAPSGGNGQPWRFAFAIAGTPLFEQFFDLLVEGNRAWCRRAGALVIVGSKSTRAAGKPNRTHALDTGAAWMSLALQGSRLGLVVHGMGGFDDLRAAQVAGAVPGVEIQHMVAIGYPGAADLLSDKDRANEFPNDRKPARSFVAEGRFPDEVSG